MSLPRLWPVALLLATLAFAAGPFLVPNFGGFDPDRFPVPQNDPPVQPAGYAFAIWGLIYLWLLISAGFGLLFRFGAVDWQAMRPTLTLSLTIGATWLLAAKASPLAATLLIWLMLAAAAMALLRAPLLDRWWAQAPVAIYTGWLSAASFVSLGLMLAGFGLMEETNAALLCLTGAVIFASVIQIRLMGAPEYGAAVVWALIAIVIANLNGSWLVAVAALIAIVIVGFLALRALRY